MGKVCFGLALPGVLRLLGFMFEPLMTSAEIHRITGEPHRVERPRDPSRLAVATWNIEQGLEYDEILASLRALDADLLLLQEVDRYARRTGYRDIARDLAHALDMNWVSGGEFQEIGQGTSDRAATTGQAILSRWPIADAEVVRFKAQARWRWSINPVQPRRGGRMALKARVGGVLIYNTHIESGGNDSLQRRQIDEIIADESKTAGSTLVLIGGDFNNGPLLRHSMFRSLTAADFTDALGDPSGRGRTSTGQRHPIDWIFVKNASSGSGRVVDTKRASDHFPVIAAFGASPALMLSR
jgi:endonuclease/exonuclease/phosphatase family metal-dependent hydrolase